MIEVVTFPGDQCILLSETVEKGSGLNLQSKWVNNGEAQIKTIGNLIK